MRILAILILAIGLSACSIPHDTKTPNVKIYWENPEVLVGCQYQGQVIGSQGSWYDFWLYSNKDLTQGALNQLREQALNLNSNLIYLYHPTSFASSVTLLGNAYHCPE